MSRKSDSRSWAWLASFQNLLNERRKKKNVFARRRLLPKHLRPKTFPSLKTFASSFSVSNISRKNLSMLRPLHFQRCIRRRNFQLVHASLQKIILRVTRKPSSSSSSSEEICANVVFVRRNLRIRRLRPKQLEYFCLMTFYGWWLAASGGFCLEHDLNDVIK